MLCGRGWMLCGRGWMLCGRGWRLCVLGIDDLKERVNAGRAALTHVARSRPRSTPMVVLPVRIR
jgi:hypothetical protein